MIAEIPLPMTRASWDGVVEFMVGSTGMGMRFGSTGMEMGVDPTGPEDAAIERLGFGASKSDVVDFLFRDAEAKAGPRESAATEAVAAGLMRVDAPTAATS